MITRADFLKFVASVPLWAEGQPQSLQPPLTPEAMRQRQEAWQEAIRPPIACVFKDSTTALYSSAVNAILCWAEVGTVTWLGTQMGIKRVEKGQPPRHYTQRDGIPTTGVTAIVADVRGVFALLTNGDEECLYSLDSKTDRWSVLARWPLSMLDNYGARSPGFLALNPNVVIASPRVVSTAAVEPLVCYDRELGARRSLPWDVATRSDHRRFIVSYFNCQEKTVQLGTNIGLIELPLSADGGPWTRRLTDFSISKGVSGGGALYLWLSKRSPGSTPETLENTGTLHHIDTTRWEAQPLPPGNLYNQSNAAVDDKGALWLASPAEQMNVSFIFATGQMDGLGTLHRWQPGATSWQVYRPDGSDASRPASPPQVLPFSLPTIAGAEVIPDAIARLATRDNGQFSYFSISQLSSLGVSFPEPSMPLQWMRVRFPHWLSTDVFKELQAVPEIHLSIYCFALKEPGKSSKAWTGVPGALNAIAPSSLPGSVLPPEGRPESAPWRPTLPELPVQQRVALPKATFALRAGLRRMLPLENGRWLAVGSRIFLVDKNGARWQEIAYSREHTQIGDLSPSDNVFVLGPRQEIFAALWDSSKLQRLNPKTNRLIPTELDYPKNTEFIGGSASGAWWRGYDQELHRLLPEGKGWQKYRFPVLKGFQPQSNNIPLAASRLWQRGYEEGRYVIRGWSPETNTWGGPLQTDGFFSLWEDSPRSCLVLTRQNSGQQFILHRWEEKSGLWTELEPFAIKLPESEPALVAVDDKAIWLSTSQALHRWDRHTDTLRSFPLPIGERLESGFNGVGIRAGKDAFFLIGSSGLWRLDRKTLAWATWTIPVPSEKVTPTVAASDSETIWGTLDALSTRATAVFRFAPKTNSFTFFDKKQGVPEDGKGRLVSDGAVAWILHPGGAYRYDSTAGRFVLIAPGTPVALARDAGGTWISVQPPKYGETTLWYRKDANGQVTPESESKQKRSGQLLVVPEGLLACTDRGLYLITSPGSWKQIDTYGVIPAALHRSKESHVWVSSPQGLLRLRLS
ncbi:MAG: hypothetical protein QM758_21345 [Armatimonas sp.]